MFTPSPQQSTIFDFVRADTRSLIVEARAGSGKTTTLVELSAFLPTTSSCLFLAFNKNIATELQTRLPIYVQAKTFHSHCFNALQSNLPKRPKVDDKKTVWLMKDALSEQDFNRYIKFIPRLIGYAKNAGMSTDLLEDVPVSWFTLIDHYNLILDSNGNESEAVEIASDLLRKSNLETWRIDFDDMLYLALQRQISFNKYNFVMLDEAQDTNCVQRALLRRMLAPTGRLIAVGDPAQSIYGFRGADADAIALLETDFSCVTLPLSVSYRCSKAVVMEARKHLI